MNMKKNIPLFNRELSLTVQGLPLCGFKCYKIVHRYKLWKPH